MIIYLLNTGIFAPPAERKRVWMEPGEPLMIGKGSVIRLLLNRENDGRDVEPVLRIDALNGACSEFPLPVGYPLHPDPHADCLILPRAMMMDNNGQPARALIEFVDRKITVRAIRT